MSKLLSEDYRGIRQTTFLKECHSNCSLIDEYLVDSFSAGNFCKDVARVNLEQKYTPLLEVTDAFNRQSVSFQISKNARLHSWLKYKEGFSADLVNTLLDITGVKAGATILDPFFGSGTTGLVCQMRGINCIGFDILPLSKIAIDAKKNVFSYNIKELKRLIEDVKRLEIPSNYKKRVNSVPITKYAYPDETEQFLAYINEWILLSQYTPEAKNILQLAVINSLEKISYTAKDGQYLRWDYRSKKVIKANERRQKGGKPPLKTRFDKGEIPSAKETIVQELELILNDVLHVQKNRMLTNDATVSFHQESVLKALPSMVSNSVDGVITSPPYCNRYDYTRTYALELAYLGLSNKDIKHLRQTLLSCTVENKSKQQQMREIYINNGRLNDFIEIQEKINGNKTFKEIMSALQKRASNKELNNKGVLRMVEGYFTELAFVYAELFRVCKPGAYVAFVNDNVRYGGEVIPVDFLSCDFAEAFGFEIKKIFCLKQQKGNSSQQMKKYGRVPLRKSITVWQKPIN